MRLDNKILYLSFHNSLKRKFGTNRLIQKKELLTKLGRQFLVPKRLREQAIKELISLGLFKEEDNKYIKILDGNFNIDDNEDKFYKQLLMFLL